MTEEKENVMQLYNVTVRLNDRARPMDRGDIYEDPLAELLESRGIGKVVGGGSQLAMNREISFCELELELNDASDATLRIITDALDKMGAPKGSNLILHEPKREIPFGNNEGLAVYLNGTDLPKEVYETSDVNFVIEEFVRLLDPVGHIHSFWEGAAETGLYMYGHSFQEMKERLAGFMESYPLCQKARMSQIA